MFGHDGYMPEGFLLEQARELEEARGQFRKIDVLAIAPVAGVCNWAPLGAGPAVSDEEISAAASTTSAASTNATSPTPPPRAAGSGRPPTRRVVAPVSDFEMTLRTKCVVLDPPMREGVRGTGVEGYGARHPALRQQRRSWGSTRASTTIATADVQHRRHDLAHRFAATSPRPLETIDGMSWSSLRAGYCTD